MESGNSAGMKIIILFSSFSSSAKTALKVEIENKPRPGRNTCPGLIDSAKREQAEKLKIFILVQRVVYWQPQQNNRRPRRQVLEGLPV